LEKIPNRDFAGKSMAYPNSAKIPNCDFALFFAWRQKQGCNHYDKTGIFPGGSPKNESKSQIPGREPQTGGERLIINLMTTSLHIPIINRINDLRGVSSA
jgi:hypothetical protein